MLKSNLCDYSDTYILVSGTITVAALVAGGGNNNIQVVFKNWTSFTDCIREINNTQIDNDKDIDIVMPIYNLKEYRDNFSRTSGRDESALTDAGAADNFPGNSASFKFKEKITSATGNDATNMLK